MAVQNITVSTSVGESDVLALTEEQRAAIYREWYFQLVVPPVTEYLNLKYPRYQGFYGYCQIMSGDYVVQTVPLQYVNQRIYSESTAEFIESVDFDACIYRFLKRAIKLYSVAPGVVDDTPDSAKVVVVKTRTTSLRFRLLPGVAANVTLVYGKFASSCGNEVEISDGPEIPDANNKTPAGNNEEDFPREDPKDPTGNQGDFDEPDYDFPDALLGKYVTEVLLGSPAGTTETYEVPATQFDSFDIVPIPVRTDTPECFQGRIGGVLNGQLRWTTQNCVSPVLNFITTFVPPGGG